MAKSSYELAGGFKVSTPQVIDSRLLLTKSEREAVDPSRMPNGYFTMGADADEITGKQELYIYNKKENNGETTNEWKPLATQEYTDKAIHMEAQHIPGTINEYVGVITWLGKDEGKDLNYPVVENLE